MSESDQTDLWGELEEMDHSDIEDLRGEHKRLLATMDDELRGLKAERKEQVEIVKSLRSAIGKVEVADSGRRSLLREFHRSRKSAQKEKGVRDSINKCVPPPANILLEWLSVTHTRLTTVDNDLTAVPMLNREFDSFSRFFELQSAIERKKVAESAHGRYAAYVSEMREITTKLDKYKAEKERSVSEITEDLGIEDRNITRKEIRGISNRISDIDNRMDSLIEERRTARKELRRIEAYSRISRSGHGRVKISDIKDVARSGGTLSTGEMDALLKMGGLASLGNQTDDKKQPTTGKKRKKKGRKLGVSRSGSRKGKLATRKE
ncbi:MAG: hypothetical protein QGF28_04590 [Candidatus Thalassarchaeaceae archaeon]|jgi:hypothetical protein|nr:hypothetical protein [Euryarchaeota archaeon]MDP6220627.1 hypothetical protein [Candidatus Thalassarchaeaceae archaeon]MBV44015.1 hypothetical protein [Euryarchaeota archaeon]MDP7092513.1 hypothetical protein [Candidatus Thalassarchaeaceae archaeon]MDP7257079.1 hypothetical protein [Candidatus Thalassarchaeaceae archaeon]|tara:strand:- start:11257 stop:12219 length:963 start_codon:yes stop_codon:yes gene_type:complete